MGQGEAAPRGLLPAAPSLALRKEAEDALEKVREARTERRVRAVLTEVNEKIRAALLRPPPGPLLNLTEFDVEAVVADWRADREA